jgi:hypothetical protein
VGLASLLPPNAVSSRISVAAFERMTALAAEGLNQTLVQAGDVKTNTIVSNK